MTPYATYLGTIVNSVVNISTIAVIAVRKQQCD